MFYDKDLFKIFKDQDVPPGTENILLVDDKTAISQYCKVLLESMGYKINSPMDPKTALVNFRQQPYCFDLLVTDYKMEPLNGSILATTIVGIRPELPIIAFTGHPEMACQHNVFWCVIPKTSTIREIGVAIRQVLDAVRPPVINRFE